MKTCPSCHKTYQDESMVFCLDDGTRLVREEAGHDANATWNLPPPGPTVASPRPTSPTAQSTLTSRPEPFQRAAPPDGHGRGESRSSALPWIFAIVVVLAVSGVIAAWLISRGGSGDVSAKYPTSSPLPTIVSNPSPEPRATEPMISRTPEERPSPTPNRQPSPQPTKERPKQMFTTLNNTSLNGSRITYYQRTSFALCEADCAANANCKGLAWIRPGAYNPGDPGMCYLLSAVTGRVPHPCCIAAVRN
jgi:hypothetical protein